jgi:murein L,D-transpeptidase YcbB/YkuD
MRPVRLFAAVAAAFIPFTAAAEPVDYELAPVATDAFLEDAATQTVWSDANYQALISAIEGLRAHGLTPTDYHLEELVLAANPQERDWIATDAWMSAAAHMLYGKLNPVSIEPDWTAARREADLAAVLAYALETGTIATSLEQLAPVQPAYGALKDELAALRKDAGKPISKVSEGPALKSGMTGPRVVELQARLVQLGLLEEAQATGTMDADTVNAVETFQTAENLDADGVVGAASIRALNRGPQTRIQQVRVNMERWRWLPGDLGQKHLRANIAGFDVTAYENGEPQRTHLTIVGKPYRRTPVFSDQIEYIVFNPWWETPPSLARADKLPMFKKDPGSVSRLGFQVLDRSGQPVNASTIDWNAIPVGTMPYRIRQAPGPQNALGQVKIMFPNPHNVYLHDTPTRGLFAQRQRAFSSGCLRTQDPIGLSEWLLKDTPGWDRAKIDTAVASAKETRANLAAKVPVHILYFTAVKDEAGGIRYLDDIYARDSHVLTGLGMTPDESTS